MRLLRLACGPKLGKRTRAGLGGFWRASAQLHRFSGPETREAAEGWRVRGFGAVCVTAFRAIHPLLVSTLPLATAAAYDGRLPGYSRQ